jgi:hypothetical protein
MQNTPLWIDLGLIDNVLLMTYRNHTGYTYDLLNRVTNFGNVNIGWGVWNEPQGSTNALFKAHLCELNRLGHNKSTKLFQYSSTHTPEQVEIAREYMNDTLAVYQEKVTKLQVIPGTSFTFALNGVDKTINYADVADHTTSGPLQKHVEDIYGEQPFVICTRYTTTDVQLSGRDYY